MEFHLLNRCKHHQHKYAHITMILHHLVLWTFSRSAQIHMTQAHNWLTGCTKIIVFVFAGYTFVVWHLLKLTFKQRRRFFSPPINQKNRFTCNGMFKPPCVSSSILSLLCGLEKRSIWISSGIYFSQALRIPSEIFKQIGMFSLQ